MTLVNIGSGLGGWWDETVDWWGDVLDPNKPADTSGMFEPIVGQPGNTLPEGDIFEPITRESVLASPERQALDAARRAEAAAAAEAARRAEAAAAAEAARRAEGSRDAGGRYTDRPSPVAPPSVPSYQRETPASGSGVPVWVWIVGVLGVGAVVYATTRK